MTARTWTRSALAGVALSGLGCFGHVQEYTRPATPTAAGLNPADLVDPSAESGARVVTDAVSLYQVAEKIKAENRPAVMPPKRSVLCLSGGGAYGAYSAGVLIGWTRAGTRPSFDVVTGISTGALIAPLAFLGSDYDAELEAMYTRIRRDDLFRINKSIRTLFGESLADNAPLVEKLQQSITPALMARVAQEHAKGRRLYVGTTDLDGHRQVIWDLGAIASRGRPEDLGLFQNVVLASASIPGFFPPVRIPISVDGKVYEERHVDGGVSSALFFRPPYVPPEKRADASANSLYNTDLYLVVAGKLYADPEPVRPRALAIAGSSVSSLIYSQTRGDLFTLYTASVLTGMNYHVTAVPGDVRITSASTDFDPADMRKLFDAGLGQVAAGTVWRSTPPGLERGEGVSQRAGVDLTRVPSDKPPPLAEPKSKPGELRPVVREPEFNK